MRRGIWVAASLVAEALWLTMVTLRWRHGTWDTCVWMAAAADRRLGLNEGDFVLAGESLRWHAREPATMERHERWEALVRAHDTYPQCLVGWARVVAFGVPTSLPQALKWRSRVASGT